MKKYCVNDLTKPCRRHHCAGWIEPNGPEGRCGLIIMPSRDEHFAAELVVADSTIQELRDHIGDAIRALNDVETTHAVRVANARGRLGKAPL